MSAATRIVERGQEMYISLTWLAKDGLIYQVLGATTSGRWEEHRPTFEATAESFRAPSTEELNEVYENRLRLAAAKADETLSAIAKRTKSEWSAAKIAVANAMTTKAKLSDGEPIKVSKREPYSF